MGSRGRGTGGAGGLGGPEARGQAEAARGSL